MKSKKAISAKSKGRMAEKSKERPTRRKTKNQEMPDNHYGLPDSDDPLAMSYSKQ